MKRYVRMDYGEVILSVDADPVAAFDDAFWSSTTKAELGDAIIGYLGQDVRGRDFFANQIVEICVSAYVDQFTSIDG